MREIKIVLKEIQIYLQKLKEYLKKHKSSITTAALMTILMHVVLDSLMFMGLTLALL
jgi:hypothetical protein